MIQVRTCALFRAPRCLVCAQHPAVRCLEPWALGFKMCGWCLERVASALFGEARAGRDAAEAAA